MIVWIKWPIYYILNFLLRLAHLKWNRLNTWLILDVVVVDIIVVDDISYILGWMLITTLI